MATTQHWRRLAACRDKNPDLWFPVSDAPSPGPALRDLLAALEVCKTCPVKGQCLEFAIRTGQAHGIWGGMTPRERRYSRACRRLREALVPS